MSTFYVILETARERTHREMRTLDLENRRFVALEADNIQDAWDKARGHWYLGEVRPDLENLPNTQIVDIVTEEPVIEPKKSMEEITAELLKGSTHGEDTNTEQHPSRNSNGSGT